MSKYDKPLTLDQIAAIQDEDIDFSDIPELDDGFWRDANLVEPDRTEQITLRVKGSVLAYFKASGKGYQTRINQVLESYVQRAQSRAGRESQKSPELSTVLKEIRESQSGLEQSAVFERMIQEFRDIQKSLEQSTVLKEIQEIQRGLEESTVLKAITESAVLKAMEESQIWKESAVLKAIEESQIWKESAVLKAITASAVQAITESAVAGGMQRNLIDSSSR